MEQETTYRALFEAGAEMLTGAQVAEAALDARLLLEAVLGTTHETLLADGERSVDALQAEQYHALIKQRAARIPLAYILGTQDFMGLTFRVTADVLIPNPDTETLVEAALACVQDGAQILDLCTGSGCVGLSLLHHSKDTRLVATDISEAALEVARENAVRLTLSDRATFVACDLFPEPASLSGFNLIVSNPPYIATDVIETLESEVRDHEPRLALDGGQDGLSFYRRIAEGVGRFLLPGGHLLVEIGYDQGEAVAALMREAGFTDVRVLRDLAGLDRVVLCSLVV